MAADPATPGSVRLGNKRQGSPLKPRPGETVIDIDRTNPILGNPFILKDHRNDAQRAEVIARYEEKYRADIARHGPMARATEALAERVKQGETLILMCWCAPMPCHRHSVIKRIAELVERRPEVKAQSSAPDAQAARGPSARPNRLKPDLSRAARQIEAFGPAPVAPKRDPSTRSDSSSDRASGTHGSPKVLDETKSPSNPETNSLSSPGFR